MNIAMFHMGEKNESIRLLNGPNDIFLAGEEDHEGRIPIGKRELTQKADRYPEVWSPSDQPAAHLFACSWLTLL